MANVAEKLLTFADAAALDPDEHPGELVDGRLVPVTRNTWKQGHVVVNVAVLLKLYAKSHPGWDVAAADPGTKLRRSPDALRGPDVAVVRAERVPKGKGAEGWLEGAPDIVVEVMGDDQTASRLARKALEYIAAGAKQVWVVDSDAESVMVYTPPDHVKVLGKDDALEGAEALPGFTCRVGELFE
jgi:Uma2 family endonuclease